MLLISRISAFWPFSGQADPPKLFYGKIQYLTARSRPVIPSPRDRRAKNVKFTCFLAVFQPSLFAPQKKIMMVLISRFSTFSQFSGQTDPPKLFYGKIQYLTWRSRPVIPSPRDRRAENVKFPCFLAVFQPSLFAPQKIIMLKIVDFPIFDFLAVFGPSRPAEIILRKNSVSNMAFSPRNSFSSRS